jgi:hypothetical protein
MSNFLGRSRGFWAGLENASAQNFDNFFDFRYQRVYDDWRFRPPVAGRSGDMTNSYHNGSLVIVLQIGLRRTDGKPHHFCATFQSLFPKVYNGLPAAGRQTEAKLSLANLKDDDVEQSVFVKIIEIAEEGQQGREGWVPSVVRLHSLDSGLHVGAQGLESPQLFREVFGLVGNGELQNLFIGGRVLPGFVNSKSVNEVVQSRSQIVDTIAENQAPSVKGGFGFNILNNQAVAGAVSIELSADDVRVAVNPSFQFSVERVRMFFSTPDFEPAISELRSKHTLFISC